MSINFALLFAGLNWPPEKPWVLLITIPALILGIIPFLRLNKKRRVSSRHLIPFIIHMSLILILSTVVAGISYTENTLFTDGKIVMFAVDMSDSNAPSKNKMNQHMHDVMEAAAEAEKDYKENEKTKFGMVVFGGGEEGILSNKSGVSVIKPGELTLNTIDFLSEYEADEEDETDLRDKSDLNVALNTVMDVLVGEDRLDTTYENNDKKIILMSDGRENYGNVYYATQDLAEFDVALECAYFNYLDEGDAASEIQVIGLETKGEAIVDKPYSATVTVNSTGRIYDATIYLRDVVTNNILATETGVTIPAGISAYKLEFNAEKFNYLEGVDPDDSSVDFEAVSDIMEKNIQAVKVEITTKNKNGYFFCSNCKIGVPKNELDAKNRCQICNSIATEMPDDALVQNNTYYTWYKFKSQGKILIVAGEETQVSVKGDSVKKSQIDVAKLEASSGYEIDVYRQDIAEKHKGNISLMEKDGCVAYPDTLEKLLEYDEVILMNVDFSKLPKNATENIKRFVEEVGRGLLFTSGDNIYSEEEVISGIKGMSEKIGVAEENEEPVGSFVIDETIKELLPVDLQISKEKETIAMVLVVDLSSSMKEIIEDSPLICKYCQYEDSEGEDPAYCPQCFADSNFVKPTRYQVALSSVKKVIMGELSADADVSGKGTDPDEEDEEKEEKKTLQDYDYVGVIAFNQGYHVALDIQMLGDKENREELCEKVTKEFDHFYYAHYTDPETNEESDIRINADDKLTDITGTDKKHDPVYINGVRYNWYNVKYTRVEKNDNDKYTGEIKTYEGEYLIESGKYAPGGEDKATKDMIKSHGTAYKPPMQEASAMLTRVTSKTSVEVKQIVFMSDGAPNDQGSGYEGIVERLAKGGTRTTAIAIGITESDVKALEELNKISTAGKGDIFLVDKAGDLEETLFKITDEITKEIRNDAIEAEIMADSLDSTVYEGVEYDEGYDIIHGYYATSIKEEANRIFYVETLRPLYAEWEYGLGKVCILMTDLGNKEWTGSLFDDTDGRANSRLVQNILLSPIRNRVDSTGLEYSMVRDDEKIVVNISTYADITKRDKVIIDNENGDWYYKEKIKAIIYVQEETNGINLWKNAGEYYATHVAGKDYTITLPTEFSDKTYVVQLKLVKTGDIEDIQDASEISFETFGDDPLCDSVAFAVVGQTLEEYDVLSDTNNNESGIVLLSSLVTDKTVEDLEEDEEATLATKSFFTNYNSNRVTKMFTRTEADMKEIPETHNIDIPLVVLALILFIIDLIFRNFVIKKKKKKVREMTDEEQLESMRGR